MSDQYYVWSDILTCNPRKIIITTDGSQTIATTQELSWQAEADTHIIGVTQGAGLQ